MAGPQSAIQQNIQTAVGTQTMAQNATPFQANNGNPNIVYNQPGVGAGYIPPMLGADGIWRVNEIPTVDPFWTDLSVQPGTIPKINLPAAPVPPTPTGPQTGGNGQQQPAVTYSPLGDYVAHINGIPQPQSQYYNTDPAYKKAWDRAVAEHQATFGKYYTKDSDINVIRDAVRRYYAEYGGKGIPSDGKSYGGVTTGGGGNPFTQGPPTTGKPVGNPTGKGAGAGGGDAANPWTSSPEFMNMWGSGASYPQSFTKYGVTQQDLQNPTYVTQSQVDNAVKDNSAMKDFFDGSVDALKRKLGVGEGGEISVMQILDLISEPLLPGNLYLEHEGKVSTQNLVKALVSTVVGPLGKPLLALIGKVIPSVGKWLQQGKIDQALNALGAKIKQEGLDDTAFGTSTFSGGGGCVAVTSRVPGFEKAGDIKVGDTMQTIDAETFERGKDEITQAKAMLQPCVEITTESGIQLECSTTAPIADKDGNQVLAPDLLDVIIPVIDHGEQRYEKVVSVEDIGLRTVIKITCGNKFFLAGKESGRYILHHNVKFVEGSGVNFYGGGGGGSGPLWGAGGPWGQGGLTGTVTVGGVENIK